MNNKRLKLGLLFYFSPQWMGGIIYIINVIKTLNFLDNEEKPEIYLFYRPDVKEFLDEFDYPYIKKIEWDFPDIEKGNLTSLILRKNIFVADILKQYSLDAIFPMHDFPVRIKSHTKLIAWWADLQEKHYPDFFSWSQNLGRDIRIKLILKNCDHLVVSSQDVLDDFNRFYKMPEHLNVHIYHFVSVIDNLESLKIEDLRAKYSLPETYFMVSNQFHKHKNHKVVLQTLIKLKKEGKNVHVAFTGKFPAATGSPYLAELHQLINDNDLHDQVIMLGLISRNEQLQLMRYSQAVIQPSLFEGWSTVIEDAKSLQAPVIASNLSVNIEQLGKDGAYFNPDNPDELADILRDYPVRDTEDVFYEDYSVRVKNAAKSLLFIFDGKYE